MPIGLGSRLLGLTEPGKELAVRRELLLRLGPDARGSGRGRGRTRLSGSLKRWNVRFRRRFVGLSRGRHPSRIILEGRKFLTF